jgi:hypothetical protein
MAADDMSEPAPPSAAIVPWLATSRAEVASRAQRWLTSAALAELTGRLGGPDPSQADAQTLRAWSAATLDTRQGAERQEARVTDWDASRIEPLLHSAHALGLIATATPVRPAYDAGLVLGGATTGNRLRSELAAELTQSGVTFTELVGLTAARPLGRSELQSEPVSANNTTEWQNLSRYLHRVFGPLQSEATSTGGDGTQAWREEALISPNGDKLRLTVAPSSTAQRRATTGDAVRFYLTRTPKDRRASLLIITSSIYAPYQFFTVAPLLLDAGAEHVELVGTPTAQDDPKLLAQRIGQEIHAAIEAAGRLLTSS